MNRLSWMLFLFVSACAPDVAEVPAWTAGAHVRYQLELRSTLTLPDGAEAEFGLDGVWAMHAASTEDGLRADVRLESPRVQTQDPVEQARLQAHFGRPFRLNFDTRGAVTSVAVAADTAVLVQTTLKSVAAQLQLVRGDGDAWSTSEADTSGVYDADYRWEAGSVVRRKTGYDRLRGDAGLEAPGRLRIEVLESRTVFAADLSRVHTVERLRFPGADLLPGVSARTELSMVRLAPGDAALPVAANDLVGGPLYGPPTEQALQYEIDRQKDPGDPFPQLLARAAAPDLERTQRDRLYLALVARLRWSEDAVREAVEHLGGPHDALLTGALGHAGSPTCQRALLQHDQLVAIGQVAHPTSATLDALRARLDLRQAQYSLGSLVFRMRDRDPVRARLAFGWLVERLGTARSQAAVLTALRAIGNAGHPDALPALSPYLASTEHAVRLEAVKALRRIPGASVDSRLAELVRSDRSQRVRQAAHAMLSKRRRA